jgi:hypothetical protein
MTLVRKFIQEAPTGSAVVLAGREHFFRTGNPSRTNPSGRSETLRAVFAALDFAYELHVSGAQISLRALDLAKCPQYGPLAYSCALSELRDEDPRR